MNITESSTEYKPIDQFSLTIFPSITGNYTQPWSGTIDDLSSWLSEQEAKHKFDLMLVSGARYGDSKTAKGSLRHRGNIAGVFAVIAEHDAGTMTIQNATQSLRDAGVAGLLYSTPSSTFDKPRWRVVCPLSNEKPASTYSALVDKLHGVLSSALAPESWDVSRSYFAGFVEGKERILETVFGTCLDQCNELETIGKPVGKGALGEGKQKSPEELRGFDPEWLSRLVDEIKTQNDSYGDWISAGMAMKGAGLEFKTFEIYSEKSESFQDETAFIDDKWQGFAPDLAGVRAVLRLLERHGINASEYEAAAALEEAKDSFSAVPQQPTLLEFLSVKSWLARDIPAPDRLLGHLLTTTARIFIVGRTGLGKTLFGYGMVAGMASGSGFLHWQASRAAKVLIIDGEMPSELIKTRLHEALRRVGKLVPEGNLFVFARDLEEQFAEKFPQIGKFQPLNTVGGRAWLLNLVDALGGVDAILFDNVMSLISGDQKDEIAWTDTLPLIQALTSRRIGQVWLDHTGHNQDRQYGSSTKAWRFDAVGILTPLDADTGVAFTLSFDHPGKARRRTPDNWQDFGTHAIKLDGDLWTSEAVEKPGKVKKQEICATEILGHLRSAGGSSTEAKLKTAYIKDSTGTRDAARMSFSRGLELLINSKRVVAIGGKLRVPEAPLRAGVIATDWHESLLESVQ